MLSLRWPRFSYGPLAFVVLTVVDIEPAAADFTVTEVEASLEQHALKISTKSSLTLGEQAQLAVENGVPLVIRTQIALKGPGLLWDDTVLKYSLYQELRYHSLADRYVVEDLDSGDMDTYGTISEALKSMAVIRSRNLPLPVGENIEGPGYTLEVRSLLDINRLPAALRPLAFFSSAWRLSSGWTRWQVVHP